MSTGFNLKRAVMERGFGLRPLVWPVLDTVDFGYRALQRKTHYPPLSYRQLVTGRFWCSLDDFDAGGRDLIRIMAATCGLSQGQTFLDIGSGCGRLALRILETLAGSGRYVGFDVDARMVEWCRRNIASRHANASFFHIDAHNSFYNPQAQTRAKD